MSAPWTTVAALALLQAVASPAAQVSRAGGLAGVVLQAENGAPIAGATVYAIGPPTQRLTTARSGTDGRWRLPDLPPGVYRIVVGAPGFAPAWVEQGGPSDAHRVTASRAPGSGWILKAGERILSRGSREQAASRGG
ncbi:MAG: carboxypeptidase-like regulatory domain-containing protein [Vicinamibacterales bacterium]